MIKIRNDLQREIIKVSFLEPGPETELDLSKFKNYVKAFRSAVEEEYELNSGDELITISKSNNRPKLDIIMLEIMGNGSSETGEYVSFLMESINGEPFKNIIVYNREYNEIDQIEV